MIGGCGGAKGTAAVAGTFRSRRSAVGADLTKRMMTDDLLVGSHRRAAEKEGDATAP